MYLYLVTSLFPLVTAGVLLAFSFRLARFRRDAASRILVLAAGLSFGCFLLVDLINFVGSWKNSLLAEAFRRAYPYILALWFVPWLANLVWSITMLLCYAKKLEPVSARPMFHVRTLRAVSVVGCVVVVLYCSLYGYARGTHLFVRTGNVYHSEAEHREFGSAVRYCWPCYFNTQLRISAAPPNVPYAYALPPPPIAAEVSSLAFYPAALVETVVWNIVDLVYAPLAKPPSA